MAQEEQISYKTRIENARDLWVIVDHITGVTDYPSAIMVEDGDGNYIKSVHVRTDKLSDGSVVQVLVISNKAGA
jgi:hypothetical protein